jgi:hypothetical protein
MRHSPGRRTNDFSNAHGRKHRAELQPHENVNKLVGGSAKRFIKPVLPESRRTGRVVSFSKAAATYLSLNEISDDLMSVSRI